ncbi:MAG TPA: iron ABC transporter permease [Aliidongia sp.]|uniref:ABC transporter permease n=1 Tax=Aliidongia sp. TaxID=1914230 RepID=UPI002DDD3E8F|nr:iron ABC transporter permease [Aliidongia sp.]HEV2678834.1 iron ABC transporter permease [Aliidongia sp.]
MFWGLSALLSLIAIFPVARLLVEGAMPGGVPGFGAIDRVLQDPATWVAFGHTLWVSLVAMVISGIIGGAMALVVALTDLPAKVVLVFGFTMLLMIPSQITTIAWIELLGPASPLLKLVGLAPAPGTRHPLYSSTGITLLLGLEHAPLVFLGLRTALRSLPGDLIEAARAAGARPPRVVATIVVPLMGPSLIAGMALAFVSNIGNFGTPALLGIPARFPMLTTLIYQRLSGFGPRVLSEVAVLSLLLGVLAVGGVLFETWLAGRRDVRIDGAPAPVRIPLGPWRWPVILLVWTFLAATLLVPLAALISTALVAAYGQPLGLATATLENFRFILFDHPAARRAVVNSLGLATSAAVLLSLAAVPAAYFAVWRRRRLMRALVLASELSYALPGVVLAIAAILIFIRPIFGFSLYNTLGIILMAYLARFFTLAQRPVAAAFRQLDIKLEEAAQMAGAGFVRRVLTVALPLVAPAAAAGGLLVFLTAFNELTVSALLWSAGHETLGVVVFGLEQAGDNTVAAAIASLTVGATVALMAIASFLTRNLATPVLPWQA